MGLLSMNELGGLGHDEGPGETRCLPCHFRDEEKFAMSFLPAQIREHLLREHQEIERSFKSGAVPHKLLEEHAALEDGIFPQFLPPSLARSFARDHAAYKACTPSWTCSGAG